MEKLRVQQEQTLGTLDTRVDAMMALMDRLDSLMGNRNGSRNGEANSRNSSREPRVNIMEQPNRKRTYGSTRGRGSPSRYPSDDNRPRGENVRGSSTGNRPTSHERSRQHERATGRRVQPSGKKKDC